MQKCDQMSANHKVIHEVSISHHDVATETQNIYDHKVSISLKTYTGH